MERIERAALRECLRETYRGLHFHDHQAIARAMIAIDEKIPADLALSYLTGGNLGASSERLARATARVLADRYDELVLILTSNKDLNSLNYVSGILDKYTGIIGRNEPIPAPVNNAQTVFANWQRPVERGNGVLVSGVYQIFRRYKPTEDELSDPAIRQLTGYDDYGTHPVICEVAYVNSETMECILINTERNVYWGTMFINHQGILYILLQRPSKTVRYGLHQRFYSIKLSGRRPNLYSGLCMKTGDITVRPLCAECLFVFASRAQHRCLYEDLEHLASESWRWMDVDLNSVIAQYLTEIPPDYPKSSDDPLWKRVRYINDFPLLKELAQNDSGIHTFREPLRAIDTVTLSAKSKRARIEVFRQEVDNLVSPNH